MNITKSEINILGVICDKLHIALIVTDKNHTLFYNNNFSEVILNINKKNSENFVEKILSIEGNGYTLVDNAYQKWDKIKLKLDDSNSYLLIGQLIPENENFLQNILNPLMENVKSELTQEKAFLLNIIENTPQLLYWKDRNYIYRGANKNSADMVNLKSSEEFIGKSDYDFGWDDERVKRLREEDEQIINNGVSVEVEDEIPYGDDNKIFLTSKTPIKNKYGEIIGILGISADITEQKQLEKDLKLAKESAEAANKAKTEFIANMSHDIRTPLTGVIGLSQILERDIVDPLQKEEAHLLAESGEQLLRMLNEILEDVRVGNSNDLEIIEEKFDLHAAIHSLIKLEAPTTTAKDIDLNCNISNEVPQFIISDRRKITHILLNLLGNAIKFTKTGNVTVEVNALKTLNDKVHLRFAVTDTGIGIPKELQAKVFEQFFKVESSFKGVYSGYGLGLHIVKSYVNILGGEITIASQEGHGTSVYFDLECEAAKEDVLPVDRLENDLQKISKNSSFHALLVEDNDIALKVLEDLFARSDLAYTAAKSAEHAVAILQEQSFDFIITDLGLPQMSGQELASKIREIEKDLDKFTPIFGLSAHVNDEIKQICQEFGMNDVFAKPISEKRLQAIIYYIEQELQFTKDIVNDDELFNLDALLIIDMDDALQILGGDKSFFFRIVNSMVAVEIPKDIQEIEHAYLSGDWQAVISLVHRFKSGIVYIGANKLSQACYNIESYFKSGKTELLDDLYQQFSSVLEETVIFLENLMSN